LLSRLNYDRAPAATPALADRQLGLDRDRQRFNYGYDRVFERRIFGLGIAHDLFTAISMSGRSSKRPLSFRPETGAVCGAGLGAELALRP
jgi:phosphoheptose isomerase